MAALLEPHVTFDGPRGRREGEFCESWRSGTSWQSDPGPVAAALATQSQSVRAWETGQSHGDCLPGSACSGRMDSPGSPVWTNECTMASATGRD